MTTSKEKDAIIKSLKDKVRDLQASVKEKVLTDSPNFDTIGVTFRKTKENNFETIKILIDSSSGAAKVGEVVHSSSNFYVALHNIKKVLMEEIVFPEKRKK